MSRRTPKPSHGNKKGSGKHIIQMVNEMSYREERYFRRFEALALNRIKWDGLPETIDERFLEYTLLYHGRAVIYDALEGSDPENPLILGTRGTPNGPMNLYNNYSRWISIGNGGHYQQIPEGEAIVLWDSKTRRNAGWILVQVAKELGELDHIAVVNRKQQRWGKVLSGPDAAQTDMQRLREHLESGDPFMFSINNYKEFAMEVNTLDMSSPYMQHDFQEDRLNLMNNLMIDLGIKTQPFDKSQYQHLEEVTIANDEIARIREDLLAPRREAAEAMNEKWGTDVTVDWANDEFEILNLGPSQATAGMAQSQAEGEENAGN